jgi:hypothetical protein
MTLSTDGRAGAEHAIVTNLAGLFGIGSARARINLQ